jgi:hypothetical protein
MAQRLLVLACLIWAAIPLRLSGSCPRPASPCEELAKADQVFIAEVLDATSFPRIDEQGRPYPDGITNYRFNVLEGLKGVNTGEFRAQFYFGGGQDLDYFQPGGRYLIFANRSITGIYKSGCSLTREITKTGEREWLPPMREELRLCLKRP